MILLLAVLAVAACDLPDENAGRCGSLGERVQSCVRQRVGQETVEGRTCEAVLEQRDDQKAVDECRYRKHFVIRPDCEEAETNRTDIPWYKPPRNARERVRACVDVRLLDYGCESRRVCPDVVKLLKRDCGVIERWNERAANPVGTIPGSVELACRASGGSPTQVSACCAKYGAGADCR